MSATLLPFNLVVKTTAAALFVLSLILIDKKIPYSNRIVRFLVKSGNYSYSVYLCHILVIGIFLHFTGPWMPWYYNLLIIIGITLGIHMVSAVSYRYIENGPAIKAIRNKLLTLAN
jgi:exopolysaccharide production protein ExoZ